MPRELEDAADLLRTFRQVASFALPHVNALLANERAGLAELEEHGSAFELVARLGSIFRPNNAASLQRVYNALGREGRLTSNELSVVKLSRLVAAGLLSRSARGIYVITPRYRLALRSLRAVDGRWQGQ
jgi:hypothetical protein